jgi:hypothetical protein
MKESEVPPETRTQSGDDHFLSEDKTIIREEGTKITEAITPKECI